MHISLIRTGGGKWGKDSLTGFLNVISLTGSVLIKYFFLRKGRSSAAQLSIGKRVFYVHIGTGPRTKVDTPLPPSVFSPRKGKSPAPLHSVLFGRGNLLCHLELVLKNAPIPLLPQVPHNIY